MITTMVCSIIIRMNTSGTKGSAAITDSSAYMKTLAIRVAKTWEKISSTFFR